MEYCKKCGKKIKEDAEFCKHCGTPVKSNVEKAKEKLDELEDIVEKETGGIKLGEFLIGIFVNPIKTIKTNIKKISKPKVILISIAIILILIMLSNLITSMIGSLFSKTCNYFGYCEKHFSFANLGNLDYLDLIFKKLFFSAIIIFGLAGIYYIGTLIIKKKTSYIEMLSVLTCSLLPYTFGYYVIAPILGSLYAPLSYFIKTIASIYCLLTIIFSMKEIIKIKEIDKYILFQTICLSIITIINYYIYL